MGMDVYGKKPRSKTGEYFRNNVWWWHPLWEYCVTNHPTLIDVNTAEYGHYNSGAGLDAAAARKLGEALLTDIAEGITHRYQEGYYASIAAIPRETCFCCGGTGIRTDAVGVEMHQNVKELDAELALLLGRTHGWCNGCNGEGLIDPPETSYPFEVRNVREFAEFLLDCGGFEIY